MLKNILSPDFLNAILRASTPILFATLASGIAAKSGHHQHGAGRNAAVCLFVWRYFQLTDT